TARRLTHRQTRGTAGLEQRASSSLQGSAKERKREIRHGMRKSGTEEARKDSFLVSWIPSKFCRSLSRFRSFAFPCKKSSPRSPGRVVLHAGPHGSGRMAP